MANQWLGILSIIILSQLIVVLTYEDVDEADFSTSDGRPQVEVRAVFISCEPEILNLAPESEVTRFERDELFKHRSLKDCSKKLALTVKITSDSGNSGDEYLPIEHVFEGTNEKRVRLLDPYILRLRRDMPRQAYVLRRLDTITCVLTNDAVNETDENGFETPRSRILRDVDCYSEVKEQKQMNEGDKSDPEDNLKTYFTSFQGTRLMSTVLAAYDVDKPDKDYVCTNNSLSNKRQKRNERNLVVETVTRDDTKWVQDDNFYRERDHDRKNHINDLNEAIDISNHNSVKPNKKNILDSKRAFIKSVPRKIAAGPHTNVKTRITHTTLTQDERKSEDDNLEEDIVPISTTIKISNEREKSHVNAKIKTSYSINQKDQLEDTEDIDDSNSPNTLTEDSKEHSGIKQDKRREYAARLLYSSEKDYAVYEIGSPDLWHTVDVQLFEKMSTPEGKTVWNDLTKGELASVGSVTPEWMGQDLHVKYRSSNWMPREDFTLPSASRLRLLVPINDGRVDSSASSNSTYDDSDYIVVPEDEIQNSSEEKVTENNSDLENSVNVNANVEQSHRRVMVRVSRAVLKGNEDKLNIESQGTDKYLTLRHHRPHRAQIDLEARADDNQLVRIGASGRISIAVSDNTRKSRTVLNLQVGNTGLAAARFRAVARDCYPLLPDLTKNKDLLTAGPILIPPRHTRSIRLELLVEIPADDAHCSVSLINDDGQSVAVRDVAIKKGDRCFCVWHCDCVCLSMDPKLMCRDMDEARQKAAGLSTHDRMRHARSVPCPDRVCLDLISVFSGVLITLIAMGLCKAVMGLFCSCIGTWGLRLLLRPPRILDHYYEKLLRCRCVEYDEEGWPIHPDTKTKTVHVVSIPSEFILNTIFFVCVPCIIIYDVIKAIKDRHAAKKSKCCPSPATQNVTNEVFSSHDIQELAPRWHRRRDGLRRWMTPQAQELSTELWQKSLKIRTDDHNDFMQPLLRERGSQLCGNPSRNRRPPVVEQPDSCADSEQDDTEYVLTQMQKSRESLARTQKKISNHDPSSTMEQNKKCDNK